ncbi:putative copper uptake transporter [Dioszegia hungarica]|uniref:Copper transport protein n=1 Tax=Dioszegia hungarica TaxID=4972 RepID=A0AA38HCP4_9TREE|nr:putative copper uptake transporter [Dioszegia hungarica]KAI9637294.1 putative copper uptake transporter [Dioszegia hungarica]
MDMGGMDMGGAASGPACKISMLWNWNTVDSCFLASSWHVRSNGMFAGSVIGVFLLCMMIEGVRRLGREYDRKLVAQAKLRAGITPVNSVESPTKGILPPCPTSFVLTPSWPQHLLRSLVYGTQFSAAFMVMLLGMYYNGYILIFGIFLGQTAGYVAFARDTVMGHDNGSGNCC